MLRYPRGVQGEATGVGENVEDTTGVTSIGGGGEVILALVEEAAGLLARPQMRVVAHLSLAHYYRFGDFAGEDLDSRSEAFATPGGRVAAQQDTGGGEEVVEGRDDRSEATLDRCRPHLEDEVVSVTVRHQTGDAIGLGVEETIGIVIYAEEVAVISGFFDAILKPGFGYLFVLASSNAERYLAFRVVEGVAQEASVPVHDPNHGARVSRGICYVGAVDPGVSRSRPRRSPLRQRSCFCRGFRHLCVSPFTRCLGVSC